MNRCLSLFAALALAVPASAALPKPMVSGLKNPESVCVGLDGRVYVTVIGEFDVDGDGSVVVVQDGKAVPFCEKLDDPKGIVAFKSDLYVADKTRVWKIDAKGKAAVFAAAEAFPTKPLFLNDITADEYGFLYVSDSGDLKGGAGAVFKIDHRGKVTLVVDAKKNPALKTPNGLLNDSLLHMLVADFHTGDLYRMKISNGSTEKIADGFGGTDGLIFDRFGRLYVSDWKNGKVWVIPRPGAKPILLAEGFQAAADICLDPTNRFILVPDMKGGTLTAIPAQVPGAEVDDSPLALTPTVAFPNLEWEGWKEDDNVSRRPIVLTHAGDGSNRVFVADQRGAIHVFANDQAATKASLFLDIQKKVRYNDKENEEGLLGFAFHPKFKENGEFFVFYNPKTLVTVISRFKVSKSDPNKADPASEEEIFRVERPFWNHVGGTIVFGPDGMLYVVLGDGGLANDPKLNGQKLSSLLGKVLRIDVDRKDQGLGYAIPKDNPFVVKGDAKGEIWCYGLRNPWRIAFDRKTGDLWCGEVGQNLWEEINLLTKGGNYGWSNREGLHPFGPKGTGPKPEYIEPIWEYHHDVGKSITGGTVYRGGRLSEIEGHYLYADYVTNKLWALKYDAEQKRVVANRPIPDKGFQVLSFGEDEKGEVYFLKEDKLGKGIYWYQRSASR